MQLKPDGVPGLRAFNKVQLDQASRGGSSTRTSTLPSLHNSLAASEERRRKVLPSTDALLRRYNLLPEVKPEKPKVTKPVGLKPKGRKVKASGSRFPPNYGSRPTGTVNVERQEVPPISKLVQEEQGGFINQSLLATKTESMARKPQSTARLEHLSPKPPVMARTKMFPSIVQRNRSLVKTKSTKKKQENACSECRDGECCDLHRYLKIASYFAEPLQPWICDDDSDDQWSSIPLMEYPSPKPPVKARTTMFPLISQVYMSFVKAEITKKKQENGQYSY
ncbi:hypothetical protein DPEC_G00109080 [Dallia pectoralis]|uniref:Uncharacterized protein n=2 Tax=Dallia pectoralis TaxID=75939 RepID=A0ACC2GST6_DALPE|nr:hypothetical protein DPEC_G00109080 [Dallia pectoralis]